MRITRNIGMLLLAIWLILYGLIAVLGLSFAGLGVIMGLLAIAAGIFILLGR
jgi:fatty acid desaturase